MTSMWYNLVTPFIPTEDTVKLNVCLVTAVSFHNFMLSLHKKSKSKQGTNKQTLYVLKRIEMQWKRKHHQYNSILKQNL